MIETTIFDYGRTIYDPETGQLFPHTTEVFEELIKRRIRLGLVSIAERSVAKRQEDLVRLGIDHYFGAVQIFGLRDQKDFTQVLQQLETEAARCMVVGDNLSREIAEGNRIGAYTVWTRQKLSGLYTPRNELEAPRATIDVIEGLVPLVDRLNS